MGEQQVQFKTVRQFVTYLKEQDGDTVDKEFVVDTIEEILSRPAAASGGRRGMLAGLELEDMDDEQLKREIINAKSVLYKAQQRGASEETIERNQARVDAAIAERDKRKAAAEPASEEDVYEAEETDEELEAEI